MKKFINKKGLILEYMDEDSKNSKNNNFVIIDNNTNKNDQQRSKSIVAKYSDSMSCEIGKEGVIFKKDDIAVEEKGVKKITTGKFMSMIDPKNIEVIQKIIKCRYKNVSVKELPGMSTRQYTNPIAKLLPLK
jgi:hypothetical protein